MSYAPYSEKVAARRHKPQPVETVEVIRLELKSGAGIYRDNEGKTNKISTWNRVTGSFLNEDLHQFPKKDKNLDFDDSFDQDYFFGFKDLEQYKQWVFNASWRKDFAKCHVVLSTYEVPKEFVKFGKRQLIFQKGKARLVKQESPYAYF
jgi:hypothetical protein